VGAGEQPRTDGGRRRLALVAGLALGGAALAALAWWLPDLVEAALLRAARGHGLVDPSLDVRRAGPGGLELADVRVGGEDGVAVEGLSFEWSARRLLERRLDRIAIRGLRVRATWDESGLHVPAFDPLLVGGPAAPGPGAQPLVPAAAVEIESARFELAATGGTAVADVSGELRLAASGAPERVRLALVATPWPPLLASSLEASADLAGDGSGELHGEARIASADGRLRAALRLPGGTAPGELALAVSELSLDALAPQSGVSGAASFELEGRVASADGALALRLERCAMLRVPRLALRGAGRLARPFELCLEPHAEPLLALGLAGPEASRLRAELRLAPAPFELALESGGPPLAGATPRIEAQADLALAGDAPARARIAARDGELRLGAWLAPLALAGSLDADGGALRGEARLTAAGGALALELAGEGEPSGDFAATARLAPLRLGADGPRPAQLVPALRGVVEEASGELSAEARVSRSEGALDLDARLDLRDLGFAGSGLRVAGVRGSPRLRGWPPATPGPQRIAIARVEAGAPFEDGELVFALEPSGVLAIRELRIRGLGGALRATGRLVPGAARHALALEFEDLDLAQVLAAAEVAGLEGAGTLRGATGVALANGRALFEGGRIEATGAGGLRYRPPGQPPPAYDAPQGLDLVRAALYDFHYEALSGTLAGEVDGELAISLRLHGANPALYDGHPIDLELNLKGGLFGLFRSSRSVLSVPESLERRLREGLER
jgi:hypothetical protein